MASARTRPLYYAGIALLAAWLVAMLCHAWASYSKVTLEKVRSYLRDVDIARLQGVERDKALQGLIDKINALPAEDRRLARLDREWGGWFEKMTDPEKMNFLDATLPSGFKQMIDSFEQLPEDRRKRAVSDAVRRLRENSEADPFAARPGRGGTNPPVQLNEEMQRKVINKGLQAFYSQSSAQTKAELAPFLEELQRAMESGRVFRGR